MPALPDSWSGAPLRKLHRHFDLFKCYANDALPIQATQRTPGVHGSPGLTIQLYLTTPEHGGATRFLADGVLSGGGYTDVEARQGRVLVCESGLLRQEVEVTKGVKYLMSTYAVYDVAEDKSVEVFNDI